jgi:hypothetical protein
VTHKYEVDSPERARLFYSKNIGWRFYDTANLAIAGGICADAASLLFGERATMNAVSDFIQCNGQGITKLLSSGAVSLQKMQGHTLRRLGAYAWQASKRFD